MVGPLLQFLSTVDLLQQGRHTATEQIMVYRLEVPIFRQQNLMSTLCHLVLVPQQGICENE